MSSTNRSVFTSQPIPFEALVPFGEYKSHLSTPALPFVLIMCEPTGLLTVMFAVTGTGFSAARRITNEGKVRLLSLSLLSNAAD